MNVTLKDLYFETQELCGLAEWPLNEPVNVLGKFCGVFGQVAPRDGFHYDLIQIQDNTLLLGERETTFLPPTDDLDRPLDIGDIEFIRL